MKPLRLGVIGFGRLGRACAEIIRNSTDLALAGIVRRPSSLTLPLPDSFSNVAAVSHFAEIRNLDGAVVCIPAEYASEVAYELLQHRIPVVECAVVHNEEFRTRKAELDRLATRRRVPAIVGAGWDPGALSLLRALFALLTPRGHTKITDRPGRSLHHDAGIQAVPGVKEALYAEVPCARGKVQRYVYVELRDEADLEEVSQAIRNDPLFVGEETLVFPVASVTSFEEAGRGVVIERHGESGAGPHQFLMMEARFDETVITSEIMIAAAHALPHLRPGAHSLLDIPLGAMFGAAIARAEKDWI